MKYLKSVNSKWQFFALQEKEKKPLVKSTNLDKDEFLMKVTRSFNRLYKQNWDISKSCTITDATKPSNPIVYVNDEFVKMTGYSREECIGVNCKFLQGPFTSVQDLSLLVDAMTHGKKHYVELLNYTKDGTPFMNHFVVYPVFKRKTMKIFAFVAIQIDSTFFKFEGHIRRWSAVELALWMTKDEILKPFAPIIIFNNVAGRSLNDMTIPSAVLLGFTEVAAGHFIAAAAERLAKDDLRLEEEKIEFENKTSEPMCNGAPRVLASPLPSPRLVEPATAEALVSPREESFSDSESDQFDKSPLPFGNVGKFGEDLKPLLKIGNSEQRPSFSKTMEFIVTPDPSSPRPLERTFSNKAETSRREKKKQLFHVHAIVNEVFRVNAEGRMNSFLVDPKFERYQLSNSIIRFHWIDGKLHSVVLIRQERSHLSYVIVGDNGEEEFQRDWPLKNFKKLFTQLYGGKLLKVSSRKSDTFAKITELRLANKMFVDNLLSKIGIVCRKQKQDSLEAILKNDEVKYHLFNQFLTTMEISPQRKSVLNGIEVDWHLAVEMDFDAIRQHVGNCVFLIVFDDSDDVIDPSTIHFGKVSSIVLFVRPKMEKRKIFYRVGLYFHFQIESDNSSDACFAFAKNVNFSSPSILENYYLASEELLEFVSRTFYNSACLAVKWNSALSRMYQKLFENRMQEMSKYVEGDKI